MNRIRILIMTVVGVFALLFGVMQIMVGTVMAAPTATLAFQGFEGDIADTWTYEVSPTQYNIDNADVWTDVTSVGSIAAPADGTRFWGIRDIDNPTAAGDHVMTFANFDVSGESNVAVSVKYNVIGFDSTDNMRYELILDGIAQGEMSLFAGQSGGASTNGWETLDIPVPDGAAMVGLRLIAFQNGGSDYGGWDSVTLVSDFADTTPPTVVATSPEDTAIDVVVNSDISIEFSEAVVVTPGWFNIACTESGAVTAVSDSGPLTYLLDVSNPFANGEMCTVTVISDLVTDTAGVGMTGDFSFTFTVEPVYVAPDLIITELMFNPQSFEDNWEWIEIYNTTESAIDLAGYVVDDINGSGHLTPNIAAGMVPAGETAVLYNADDITATAIFEAAWSAGINLVPVTNWGVMGMTNGGDQVGIWNSFASYNGDNQTHANVVDTVAYSGGGNNSSSITLKALDLNNNVLSNLELSVAGVDGAYTSTATAGTNFGMDVGSPGIAPPEMIPSAVGLAGVTAATSSAAWLLFVVGLMVLVSAEVVRRKHG